MRCKNDNSVEKDKSRVAIIAQVSYDGRTGVLMEVLTGVSTAALTMCDMMKRADNGMVNH